MKIARHFIALLLILTLGLVGCSHLTPAQKQTATVVGTKILGGALDLTQFAANLAVNVVLKKAEGPADALNKANKFDSAALALRTLETDTNGLVTPEDVASAVTQFTDPTKTHWDALANQLAGAITAAPDQNAALEQSAVGLNQAAAAARVNVAADVSNP
jgi:microcystin-dependent protein